MDSLGARLARGAVLFSLALLGAAALQAQHPAGEIRILVTDPSGAAVEASGRLRGPAAGIDRSFRTDSHGAYTLRSVPYGRYRLEISKDGFATQSVLIDVQSATPISRALTMTLASQTSNVEVVAATPLPGTDLALDEIPAPVQTATARDVENSGALNLGFSE